MFLMEFIVPNIEKNLKVKSDKKAFHLFLIPVLILLIYKLILMSYP